ncbi:hypothetical protein BN2497_7341 [Janthinobacterium sp. CG23_2]|nr:hypothetical protein BN2497_7341 [Janthinobacterium sp. CG23_2]CUU30068.1 hypothetical protein BN3177_7341 [Janthinobacterium sp. CG23_2]
MTALAEGQERACRLWRSRMRKVSVAAAARAAVTHAARSCNVMLPLPFCGR